MGTDDGAMAGNGAGPMLSSDQLERYSRQILMDEVGVVGQRTLLDSKVLVIGAGGLGSPASIYLVAAGVGTVGVIDADVVDVSNLHRQIVHDDADVGRLKTTSARERLEALNPDVTVVEHSVLLDRTNAFDILEQYDVIVNGCDNFPTRYLLNDACVLLEKPLVDASILRFHGQMTVFMPGEGCYRCVFPEPPAPGTVPSCGEAGIIGALAGHMGTLQAVETVKLLLGIDTPMSKQLLLYDALRAEHRYVGRRRDPACPVCGDEPTITELIDYEEFCGVPVVADADARTRPIAPASLQDTLLAKGWAKSPDEVRELLQDEGIQWIDVREEVEWRQVRFGDARHIPMSEIGERLGELEPDVPTYFLCRSGQRSGTLINVLRENGWDNVYNIHGGLISWVNEGLPVEYE